MQTLLGSSDLERYLNHNSKGSKSSTKFDTKFELLRTCTLTFFTQIGKIDIISLSNIVQNNVICIYTCTRVYQKVCRLSYEIKTTRVHQQNFEHFLYIIFLGRYRTNLDTYLFFLLNKAAQLQDITLLG